MGSHYLNKPDTKEWAGTLYPGPTRAHWHTRILSVEPHCPAPTQASRKRLYCPHYLLTAAPVHVLHLSIRNTFAVAETRAHPHSQRGIPVFTGSECHLGALL